MLKKIASVSRVGLFFNIIIIIIIIIIISLLHITHQAHEHWFQSADD